MSVDLELEQADGMAELAPFATEFRVGFEERTVYITRYDNHHNLGNGWAVMVVLGGLNPWYLSQDGKWRYKCGTSFKSPVTALVCLRRSGTKSLRG